MELLYVWINENTTGFIRQQGFNFAVNHRFTMSLSQETGEYALSYTGLPNEVDIWASNNITALTVLVGENGTGKTTLFRYLYSSFLASEEQEERPEYADFCVYQNQVNKKLLIYSINGDIQIFHNFASGALENNTGFPERNINEMEQDARIGLMETLEQQTIIYLSNSSYAADFNGYYTHGRLNAVSLTPDSLRTLSGSFYNKITKLPRGTYTLNRFITLQGILKKRKTSQDFQQICDVCYYHYLQSNHLEDRSLSKKCDDLMVSFKNIVGMIQKSDDYALIGRPEFKSTSKTIMRLSQNINDFLKWVESASIEVKMDTFCTLCLSVIFEMYYAWEDIRFSEVPVRSFKDCTKLIESILETYDQYQGKDTEQLEYYKNGLEEINILYHIISGCRTVTNRVPTTDSAYKLDRIVSIYDDENTYRAFCECIDRFARAKDSVVLKYIQIDNLHMSSGERALQNMLSWLRLPPLFDEYIESTPIPIHDDVLLMIDEIDLYMHPEWQRQCLKSFANELRNQYRENRIQVIVSTHSPLVLSDVPNQNTI